MKRLHVHLSVANLDVSIQFYSRLFAAAPTVHKTDYAKWMLEDPRVNFAISTRSAQKGLDHLGIQAEDETELQDLYGRLAGIEAPKVEQGATTCCYASSEKSWVIDPQGIAWETYHTMAQAATFGGEAAAESGKTAASSACCAPQPQAVKISMPAKSACCAPKPSQENA